MSAHAGLVVSMGSSYNLRHHG